MLVFVKQMFGGSLKITSELKNNFRGEKWPQNILRVGGGAGRVSARNLGGGGG